MRREKRGVLCFIGYDWKRDAEHVMEYATCIPFEVAEIMCQLYERHDYEYFDEYCMEHINAYPEIEPYIKGYYFETLEEFFSNHAIGIPTNRYFIDQEEMDEETFWYKSYGGFHHWCEDLTYTNIDDDGFIYVEVSRG